MPCVSLAQSSRSVLLSTAATTSTSGNFFSVLKWISEMPPHPISATRSFLPEYSALEPVAKDSVDTPVAMVESFQITMPRVLPSEGVGSTERKRAELQNPQRLSCQGTRIVPP